MLCCSVVIPFFFFFFYHNTLCGYSIREFGLKTRVAINLFAAHKVQTGIGTYLTGLIDGFSKIKLDFEPVLIINKEGKDIFRKHLNKFEYFLTSKITNTIKERVFYEHTVFKNDLKKFTEIVKKNKVKYFVGYASSIYLFAKYIHGVKEKSVRPKAIISSAEVLQADQKAFIEKTFQCKVFNRYGCRELSMIASECDRHEGMHVNSDCLYMEILYANYKESLGELVVTDLVNYAFPFIRYKIKDMGCWAEQECSCGRGLPLLKSVNGRVADFIITPKGRLVSGPSVTITVIALTPCLVQAQINQDKANHLIFKAVINDDFGEKGKDFVIKKFIDYFGNEMTVDFDFVEKIESEVSGKYRFCISKIVDEKLLNGFH